MKKITWLLLVIGLIFIVSACQKEPYLTLNSQSSISFTDQGGSQNISFSTNNAWTANSTESWCKISALSGETAEAGASITVTCEPNTTYDSRNCTVTISSGGLTQGISISQETNIGLIVSQSSFNLSSETQTIEVEVKANVKYTIEIDSSCKDWIKHVSTRALSNNTLVFDVAANNTFNDRVGSITFRQADGLLAETVTIHQKQIEVHFEVLPNRILLDSEAQSCNIEVQSNVEYEILIPEEAKSWITFSNSNRIDNQKSMLSFEVSKNNTYETRLVTIGFKLINSTIAGSVEISQDTDDIHTPLTLEAISTGKITINNPLSLSIEYFKEGSWTATQEENIVLNIAKGEKISFRGNNEAYASTTENTHVSMTNENYLYGNIMSLVGASNYSELDKVSDDAFKGLFSWSRIINHPNKPILLPAIKVGRSAYARMFSGCMFLTSVPELPATDISIECYQSMFEGCSQIEKGPSRLPASILKRSCYEGMFSGCSSLKETPELPAKYLASNCYSYMFSGCISLTTAPELPATTLAENCYSDMFHWCDNLITPPSLPATSLAKQCYMHMFSECTSLIVPPVLPAEKMADYCYQDMFSDCSSLISAALLPSVDLATGCYLRMYYNCSSLKTAYDLPATVLARWCYSEMFSGCISLEKAPALPAKELEYECYSHMFYDCRNLKYISADFISTSGDYNIKNWLSGVSESGVFVKNRAASWDLLGDSGIPIGWTVIYKD